MTWHRGPMVGFDTESTGISVENDRIVTACMTLVDGSGKTPPETIETLINPGIVIPQGAIDVHGITNERAQTEGVPARDGVDFIADVLAKLLLDQPAAPLVAHNGTYDLTILDRECRRHGLATLTQRLGDRPLHVVDTYVLSKHIDPYRKRVSADQGAHQLKTCAQVFGVGWDDDAAHNSTYDALVSARVAWMIAHKNPRLARMPLADLHALQVAEKRKQDASLAAYFRKQNKPADGLDGHWPFIPFAGQQAMA